MAEAPITPSPSEHPWYFVVRSHSHTDKQQLIKVMSRRFLNKYDAETWKELMEDEDKKRFRRKFRSHRFTVIQADFDQDVL